MLHLKEYLPGLKQGMALDVGTRFGEFAFTLVEAMPEGSRIIGMDCEPETVAQAREKSAGKGVEFMVGDAAHMDFEDGVFELVAISNTLHHIEDYGAVLDEMLRVLRPGGYFMVNEMFSDNQNEAQQTHFEQHTLEAKLDMLSGGFQRPTCGWWSCWRSPRWTASWRRKTPSWWPRLRKRPPAPPISRPFWTRPGISRPAVRRPASSAARSWFISGKRRKSL